MLFYFTTGCKRCSLTELCIVVHFVTQICEKFWFCCTLFSACSTHTFSGFDTISNNLDQMQQVLACPQGSPCTASMSGCRPDLGCYNGSQKGGIQEHTLFLTEVCRVICQMGSIVICGAGRNKKVQFFYHFALLWLKLRYSIFSCYYQMCYSVFRVVFDYSILRLLIDKTHPIPRRGDFMLLSTSDPGVLKNSKILFASLKKI